MANTRNKETQATAPASSNGNGQARKAVDVSLDNAEFVTEIPKVTRKPGKRTSKWEAVANDLKENPRNGDGTPRIRLFRDVSTSLGGQLHKQFGLVARNRNVREDGKRADLYLSAVKD